MSLPVSDDRKRDPPSQRGLTPRGRAEHFRSINQAALPAQFSVRNEAARSRLRGLPSQGSCPLREPAEAFGMMPVEMDSDASHARESHRGDLGTATKFHPLRGHARPRHSRIDPSVFPFATSCLQSRSGGHRTIPRRDGNALRPKNAKTALPTEEIGRMKRFEKFRGFFYVA